LLFYLEVDRVSLLEEFLLAEVASDSELVLAQHPTLLALGLDYTAVIGLDR
jgi:hypothetical protein